MLISYLRSLGSKQESTPKLCQHRTEPSVETCQQCKQEKSLAQKYRWKIILGLVFPFALQGLDSTIIASALPWIASDFNRISQLNWIASCFNLTSAAFIPFWAQMADVMGRTFTLTATIVLMMIGSAICTGAPVDAFPVLLLGRAFQGLAGAGINVTVRTIIADRVTLQENAKNWAIFSFVGGISYALGPVIGGYLTSADWRWCFGINLPVAAVALIILYFVLRKELLGPQPIPELDETAETGRRTKFAARMKTIDIGGQVLFLVGFALVILALTWGGATYAWNSAAVIVSLAVGVVFIGLFICWESLMAPGKLLSEKLPWQKPMIPWKILSNRNVGLLFFTEVTSGMAMYAVLYFCNIYFIAVKDFPSDKAGVQLLYFTPGLAVGIQLCSFMCNTWPKMTWPAVFFGTLIEALGIPLVAWAMKTEDKATIYGMMALVGSGVGLRMMASPLQAVGMFRKNRAAVIGLLTLAIPLGGTMGTTIMSTVFNNTSSGMDTDTDFSAIRKLPAAEQSIAKHNAKMGLFWAFIAITPLMVISFLCTLVLGNIKVGQGEGSDEDGARDIVIQDPYLWTLVRNRHDQAIEEEKGIRLTSMEQKGDSVSKQEVSATSEK